MLYTRVSSRVTGGSFNSAPGWEVGHTNLEVAHALHQGQLVGHRWVIQLSSRVRGRSYTSRGDACFTLGSAARSEEGHTTLFRLTSTLELTLLAGVRDLNILRIKNEILDQSTSGWSGWPVWHLLLFLQTPFSPYGLKIDKRKNERLLKHLFLSLQRAEHLTMPIKYEM